MLIGKLFYHPDGLNLAEFKQAQHLLEEAYRGLKPTALLEPREKRIENLLRRIYIMRIFKNIHRNIRDVRQVSLMYMRKYGLRNIFPVIYCASFLGGKVLGAFPAVYQNGIKILARARFNSKPYLKLAS